MEDAFIAQAPFEGNVGLFGVFDGHGGTLLCIIRTIGFSLCRKTFCRRIEQELKF